MSHPFDLEGRLAVVTGGGSGLGKAMAHGLAQAGARVVIVGRTAETLAEAAAGLPGGRATFEICDVSKREEISGLAERITAKIGPVDILVNNAGIQQRAPFTDFPAAGWDLMIATHLSAPFFLCQALAPSMIERRCGKIINTLSVMAELGRSTIVPYTAAKGGLRMLTRGLAVELGPHNIQVNGVAPGYFATPMNQALVEDPTFDAWVKARTPAGRWGRPEELSGAVVFLASSAADFVSGQVIFVDGGLTASV
jgi:gluconate 5-dehydrogenase